MWRGFSSDDIEKLVVLAFTAYGHIESRSSMGPKPWAWTDHDFYITMDSLVRHSEQLVTIWFRPDNIETFEEWLLPFANQINQHILAFAEYYDGKGLSLIDFDRKFRVSTGRQSERLARKGLSFAV